MRTIINLLIIILMLNSASFAQNRIYLTNWEFRQTSTNNWHKASVPGTIHTDLFNVGIIPDPFMLDNEKSLQWIDKVDWEYRTSFTISDEMKKAGSIEFTFEGLDTYAEIFVNGSKVHSHNNMFIPASIIINTSTLRDVNQLSVVFLSPIFKAYQALQEYGMPLPADNDQSENGGMGPVKVSTFVRKAPYHFGWDWGPRLVTSGIWRDAYITPINHATITGMHINQKNVSKSRADIEVILTTDLTENTEYALEILVDGELIKTNKIKGEAGNTSSNRITIPLTIESPRLWWPNGHGKQNLYSISAILKRDNSVTDSRLLKTGLRKVELIRKPDAVGESFYFNINGKPIFAKGANYIPSDVFLPRVSPQKYEYIIASAAKANMNMLRVWGGGFYENDLFYELCDKYGIMVWQDFMFACAMYPGNDEFLNQISAEADYNLERLRNHPCIVLWCGNNEIEQAWAQNEENRGWGWKQRYNNDERKRIWQAYDTIFHHILPDKVNLLSPGTPYWHSSPSAGMNKLANHTNTSGDMHYWGVWHGNEPINAYTNYKARFMSEYGFQSFPEFESVKQYTQPEDWDINSLVMRTHQRSAIGNERILQYMEQSYKKPNSFNELLYTSQLLQAEAINKAIRFHRSLMPYCMGSLYWQLNDCWPVASWSGIDYYGRWKALHYFAREAFKNQILFINVKNNAIEITGISDTESAKAVINVNLMDFSGKSLWNRPYQVTMPSNSAKLLTSIDLNKIPALQNKSNAVLYVTLSINGNVRDAQTYYFTEPKNLNLPFPDVHIHIREKPGSFDLEITSKNLCKNLMLVSEGNAYSFSDNFFDILPGEMKVVTVESDLSYSEFFKKLSYLYLK